MSKFKRIKTEYRTLKSLLNALDELGVEYEVAPSVKTPTLALEGYMGDTRKEKASIRIKRRFVDNNWSGGQSNDIGFAWNGKNFEAIISQYDQGLGKVTRAMKKIKQKYTRNEVVRNARLKGYFVKEQTQEDGTLRLALIRR